MAGSLPGLRGIEMKLCLTAMLGACALVVTDVSGAVIDFEGIPLNTKYGSPTHQPGDLVLTQNGIDMRVDTFLAGTGPIFLSATVGGFTDSFFPTTPLTVSNINLRFTVAQLPFAVGRVTFEFTDSGGLENLGVNGTVLQLSKLGLAPSSIAGVSVTVQESQFSGGTRGTVTLEGAITSVTVGGQEFGLDNFTAVPAPGVFAVAGLGLGLVWRRRRLR